MNPPRHAWMYITLWLLILPWCLYTQSISRYMIGAGGKVLSKENLSLSASIGQAGIVGTKQTGQLALNIGFQQMESALHTSVPWSLEGHEISVFPNPFVESFFMVIKGDISGRIDCRILSIEGKDVYQSETIHLSKGQKSIQFFTSNLPTGMYFISITLDPIVNPSNFYRIPIIRID